MKALMRKSASGLRQLSPLSVSTLALGCVLALGVVDYFTPGPISFVVFYMLVVVFTGWGRPAE